MMTQHTHQTAPTQFVEANGIRFAYRRFGNASGVPLVFNQHFTGTMDHWDPAVTDGLAATREVILFNNAGISSTSGEVPASVEEMAANAAAFIKVLGLAKAGLVSEPSSAFETHVKHGAKQQDNANDDKVAVLRLQLGHIFEVHTVNPGDRGGYGQYRGPSG